MLFANTIPACCYCCQFVMSPDKKIIAMLLNEIITMLLNPVPLLWTLTINDHHITNDHHCTGATIQVYLPVSTITRHGQHTHLLTAEYNDQCEGEDLKTLFMSMLILFSTWRKGFVLISIQSASCHHALFLLLPSTLLRIAAVRGNVTPLWRVLWRAPLHSHTYMTV